MSITLLMSGDSPEPTADARFEQLVERYAGQLRRQIAQHCPRNLGIQTADIEQEALVRLWRAVRDERNVDDFASYLHRIAVTTTIDAVRKVVARREEQLACDEHDEAAPMPPVVDANQSPEAIATRRETMTKLMEAIERLPQPRLAPCNFTYKDSRPRKSRSSSDGRKRKHATSPIAA